MNINYTLNICHFIRSSQTANVHGQAPTVGVQSDAQTGMKRSDAGVVDSGHLDVVEVPRMKLVDGCS